MACALTQGYTLDCRDSIGGVKEVYIIERGNIASLTELSGVITAGTKVTGKRFWKYEQIRDTSEAFEEITGSTENNSIYYNQTVSIQISKMAASVRNEILLLAQNRLTIVVTTQEGTSFMYGKTNGLMLNAGRMQTGKAGADLNGYTLTFTGWEKEAAPTVGSAVVNSLTTPG